MVNDGWRMCKIVRSDRKSAMRSDRITKSSDNALAIIDCYLKIHAGISGTSSYFVCSSGNFTVQVCGFI